MGRSVVDLEMILAKLQSSFGTMATPLTSADYVQPGKPSFAMDVPATKVESVGVNFGQDPSVIGPREAAISMSFPLRSGGAQDLPGDWTKFLQASGFKETETTNVYSYALATRAEWKDLTLWGYSGDQGSNAALRQVVANALFSAKISLDFKTAYGQIDFNGKGVYSGLPIAATQPAATRHSLVTPNLLGFIGSFFDASYTLLSINFDIGGEISVCIAPQSTDGSGKGISLFTDIKIKWDAKVYLDTAMVAQPHAKLIAGTQGATSIAWGTAPNKITVADAAMQIESVKESDENKVKTYDLSGISIGNGLTITVDTSSGS